MRSSLFPTVYRREGKTPQLIPLFGFKLELVPSPRTHFQLWSSPKILALSYFE